VPRRGENTVDHRGEALHLLIRDWKGLRSPPQFLAAWLASAARKWTASRDPYPRTARKGDVMKPRTHREQVETWVVDYSAARARAIKWLGDRYLLARPINVSENALRQATRTLLHSAAVTATSPGQTS
jgi:hypothetical protein